MKIPHDKGQLQGSVVWRNLFAAGSDYCSLWRNSRSWSLQGTAIAVLEESPVQVRYEILCDEHWQTRQVMIERIIGAEVKTLLLTVDAESHWKGDGEEFSSVLGCVDVDLAITPATNTLPICRLNLALAGSAEVTAAWVKFPDLSIAPLQQKYTRLAEQRYLYESATGFSAEITVDELGLVKTYPQGWERLAQIRPSR